MVASLEALASRTGHVASLDLVTGRVAGASGKTIAAIGAYRRVIANQSSSAHEVAIAHQNLGIELMRAGHLRDSSKEMRIAVRQHMAIDNWFGVLQVTLNLANLLMAAGDLDGAAPLGDMADRLREDFRDPLPHQQASVMALRAHIAARTGRFTDALRGYKAVLRLATRVQ